jgi:hypothetical protein
MKTPCPDCFGWVEDHAGWQPAKPNENPQQSSGVCPGRPDGVEGLLVREIAKRAPVAHRLGRFAVELFPWLRGR